MMKRCGEQGWTFVEMLLILFMLGLFTAIAMPAFSALGERAEREMFLDSLATQIQLAQLEAVSRESEVTLFLNAHEIKVNQGEEEIRTIPVPQNTIFKAIIKEIGLFFGRRGRCKGERFKSFWQDNWLEKWSFRWLPAGQKGS
jgi:Tfp pilus assembly protein FimT